MAIVRVSQSTLASGIGGLTVGAITATLEPGDLLLLFVESANEAVTTPSGYTVVPGAQVSAGTPGAIGGMLLNVFYRVVTSSGADTTTAVADTGNHTTAIKLAYRGVDPDTPFDVAPVTDIKTVESTTATYPAITTVTPHTVILWATALDLDSAATTTGASPGYTQGSIYDMEEIIDETVASGTGGGIKICSAMRPFTGTIGPMTGGVTLTQQVYITLALRPLTPLFAYGGGPVGTYAATFPSSGIWESFAFGGGTYVALSSSTTSSAVSTNGDTWVAGGPLPGTGFKSVAYGNGVFVAVGNSSLAASSTDGITWVTSYTPVAASWAEVVFGNGVFVAIASDNATYAMQSTHGLSWQAGTLPATATWRSLAFGKGVFVAACDGGAAAASSTDGIVWVSRTMPGVPANWSHIAFGNGVFIALGDSSRLAWSGDGATWNDYTRPWAIQGLSYGIEFIGGRFITSIYVNAGYRSIVASEDGLNWTEVSLTFSSNFTYAIRGAGLRLFIPYGTSITSSAYIKFYYASSKASASLTTNAVGAELVDTAVGYDITMLDSWVQAGDYAVAMAFRDGSATPPTVPISFNATQQALPVSASWRGIVFGNGVFVAFVNSNVAASSTDGVTWTQRTLPTTGAWQEGAYGNGLFVIPNANSTEYLTSTDGVNWTLRTLPVSADWRYTAFGGGVFVIVSSGSNIAVSSPDGINWTQRTLPATASWREVTYGNGRFAVVSLGSTNAATSDDGFTWTLQTLPVSTSWRTVAYGNGLFVALSLISAISATSPDGVTWTQRAMPVADAFTSLSFGNGVFVAVVGSTSTIACTSVDGINWTQQTLPADVSWEDIAFGNGVFAVISNGPSSVAAKIVIDPVILDSSGSGTSSSVLCYKRLTSGGAQSWGQFTNATSLAVSVYRGLDPTNPIGNWSKTNSLRSAPFAWDQAVGVTSGLTAAAQAGTDACFVGGRFFVSPSVSPGAIGTSTDGLTWTTVASAFTTNGTPYTVAFGASTYVAVGADNTTNISTSTNGTTWTARTSTAAGVWFRDVTFGNSLFIAVGSVGTAVSSPTGTTWTNRTVAAGFSTANPIRGIATDGAKFIACSESGELKSTTDAVTWAAVTKALTGALHDVEYNGSYWLLGGANGVNYSTDGTNFTAVTAGPSSGGVNTLSWLGDCWLASGTGATDWYSYDGQTWAACTKGPTGRCAEDQSTGTIVFPDPTGTGVKVYTAKPALPAIASTDTGATVVGFAGTTEPVTLPDGYVTYLEVSQPFVASTFKATAYGNGRFVCLGSGASGSTNGIYSDNGGRSWAASATLPSSLDWSAAAWGNGVFVAVSRTTSTGAISSTDGINWTARTLPVSTSWYEVEYENGVFIATGLNGNTATSTNGTTWVAGGAYPSFSGTNVFAIAYGNGKWVGVNSVYVYSAVSTNNGTSWTSSATGGGVSVAFGNGVFVATTGSDNVRVSSDGSSWTTYALTNSANSRVKFAYGKFVIVKYQYTMTSADGITWATTTGFTGVAPFKFAIGPNALVAPGSVDVIGVISGGIEQLAVDRVGAFSSSVNSLTVYSSGGH